MRAFVLWSEERTEQLKKLYEDGLSAAQIAAEIGGGLSRNAVIGKVHRLGLLRRGRPVSVGRPRGQKPSQGRMVQVRTPRSRVALALAEAPIEQTAAVVDDVIPMTKRLSLVQLTAATCHWPIGDPDQADFYFCGGKALSGLPYCAHHARMAYLAPGDGRRRDARR